MSDFNYEESKGPKKGANFEVSSFLGSGSYKGNMHVSPTTSKVGAVSTSEVSLGTHDKKADSIG